MLKEGDMASLFGGEDFYMLPIRKRAIGPFLEPTALFFHQILIWSFCKLSLKFLF